MFFSKRFLAKAVFCVCIVSINALIGSAYAGEFRVHLIATIDDSPAMKDVVWTVYRSDGEKYKTARKHSTHMVIPQGVYRVDARFSEDGAVKVWSRNFHVRNDTQIIVPMD